MAGFPQAPWNIPAARPFTACVAMWLTPGRSSLTDQNRDEKVSVTRSSFNLANVIAAIALLVLVLGLLKYLGVSPI